MYNAAGQINKDQLVQHFEPLVKRIAYHLMARLPSSVQVDDLIQNGMMGLLDAINRFESGMGAQFETIAQLEQEYGRAPGENELASALDMTLAEYQKMLQDARGHQLISFEDMVDDGDEDFLERHLSDDASDPSKILEDENLRQLLVQSIELLPEREKLMMALYYEQDLNLREIGDVMGVTESRVCQLHSQAVARIRARIFGEAGLMKKAKRNG